MADPVRRMIFYHPAPLGGPADAGSAVRPQAILEAFRALGFEVHPVVGSMRERMQAIREITPFLAPGAFAFVYGELLSLPLPMSEPRLALLRRHALADFHFLDACRRQQIRVGLFYRDVYWRFESPWPPGPWRLARWLALQAFHRWELVQVRRTANVVYVPHMRMAEALPVRLPTVRALPPGVTPAAAPDAPQSRSLDPLTILYVGGVGRYYRMGELLHAVNDVVRARLILVCRPEEWTTAARDYRDLLGPRIRVVHASGPDLAPLYGEADLCACLFEPSPYRRFAMPVKLFDYLGYGKPVLATEGTAVGEFVAALGLGWCVPYERGAVRRLIESLVGATTDYTARCARVSELIPSQTWIERARQVAEDLQPDGVSHDGG